MAILAAHRALFHFGVTAFTGFVCPLLAEISNFAWAFFVALFAILEHFLMFSVRECDLAD